MGKEHVCLSVCVSEVEWSELDILILMDIYKE